MLKGQSSTLAAERDKGLEQAGVQSRPLTTQTVWDLGHWRRLQRRMHWRSRSLLAYRLMATGVGMVGVASNMLDDRALLLKHPEP